MSNRFYNIGVRGVTLSVRFWLILFLAFYLTPREVGLFGLLAVTVSYALYFVCFDYYTFSTRELLNRPKEEWPGLLLSKVSLFFFLYLIILPASLFLFFFGFLPWWTAGWVCLLIVSEHLAQELSRLAVAMERPLFSSLLNFVRQGLWAVMLILFMWSAPEYRDLQTVVTFWAYGSVASVLFGAGMFWSFNWRGAVKGLSISWVLRGISVALPLLGATLALRAIMTIDRYAFEALNGAEMLGAYSLFMGMAGAMLTFMDAGVFAFLYPRMIRLAGERNWKKFHSTRMLLRRQTLIWISILIVGSGMVGPLIFRLLPEPVYYQNWPLYIGLLVGMAAFVLGMIPHYTLYSLSEDRSIIIAHISGLVIFILTLVVVSNLIPYWSVVVAFSVSGIGVWIIKEIALLRALRNLKTTTDSDCHI